METHEKEATSIEDLERRLAELERRQEEHGTRLHRVETWIRLLSGAARVFTRSES